MTLTKRQLTETALTLISEHLADLIDTANDVNDWIDEKLCEQHCPGGDCDRTEENADTELDGVKQEMRDAVTVLREVLVSRLAAASTTA